MDWLLKRLSEPSTWGGLAAVTIGAGQLAKVNEAPAIADAVGQAGQAFVAGDTIGGAAALVFGLVAAFRKDR